jgi:hypothetical protein
MPAAHWFDDGLVLGTPGIVLDFVDGPQLGAHAATADDAEQRRLPDFGLAGCCTSLLYVTRRTGRFAAR